MDNTLYHPDLPGLLLGLFLTLLTLIGLSAWIGPRAARLLVTVLFVLAWVVWTALFARYSVAMYGVITATTTVGVSLGAAFGAAYALSPKRMPGAGVSRSSYAGLVAKGLAGAASGVVLFPLVLLAVLILFGIDSV